MKYITTIPILLLIFGCASCKFPEDKADTPSLNNHNRVLLSDRDNNIELGVIGIINDDLVKTKLYSDGIAELRGTGDCGSYMGESNNEAGWVEFILPSFDNKVCVYSVHAHSNVLDYPAIGKVINYKFSNPDIEPLSMKVGDKVREGVNWTQVRGEDNRIILESHDITISPKGNSGSVIINGCGLVNDIFTHTGNVTFNLKLLYKAVNEIKQDCIFTILVNNDDYVKELGIFYVNVFTGLGGYIATPKVYKHFKKQCFEFNDNAVGAISVNGKTKYNNKLCVKESESYIVETVTRNNRVFYGVYKNGNWDIK